MDSSHQRTFQGGKDQPVPATLRQLAELVHGDVVGDADLLVQSARTLQDAQAGDITFVENDKNLSRLRSSQASAALVSRTVTSLDKALIRVADPLAAFVAVFQ